METFINSGDIENFYTSADDFVARGMLLMEYPLGALPVVILPRLIVTDLVGYGLIFSFISFLFALLGLKVIFPTKQKKNFHWYLMVLFLLLYFVLERFDIHVAVLFLLCLVYFEKKKFKLSGLFLVLASAVKFFPLLFLPFFYQRCPKKWLVLIVAVAAVTLSFANLFAVQFHFERGVAPESVYGSFWTLFNSGVTERAYRSFQLKGVSYPLIIPLASLGLGYWLAVKKGKDVFVRMYYVLMGFMIGSKVLSPQFLIWLAPLMPFLDKKKNTIIVGAALLTAWFMGFFGRAVVELEPPFVYAPLVRNMILLAGLFV